MSDLSVACLARCGRIGRRRGLCAGCYATYQRDRRAGRITEARAVVTKRLAPKRVGFK